jgi:hypothetical protein
MKITNKNRPIVLPEAPAEPLSPVVTTFVQIGATLLFIFVMVLVWF